MYKKIITLLFALMWCFTLSAQDFMEVSPYLEKPNYDPNQEAMWDLLLGFDVTALSGAAGNAGSEWDGTYLYSTRWASNLIHKYNAAGNTLIEQFSIPGVTGLRDLAFDGTYMYGGAAANTVYQMDFVSKTLIGSFSSPQPVRWIAYDEAADAFWLGNWNTPATLVSRTGTTLATFNTGLLAQYGAAYDNVSAGGPYLWIFDQGGGAGTPQLIYQFHIATGTATGVTHNVALEFPTAQGIAGGLFSMSNWQAGMFTIGGLLQGVPDNMFIYEITPVTVPPTFYYETFEGFVFPGKVACQDPVNWTTWTNQPCTGEDADISTAYAHSGTKSFVIVPGNDLVKPLGNQTTGQWYMSFWMYIPTGRYGYFNTLNTFPASSSGHWGMEVYFGYAGPSGPPTPGQAHLLAFNPAQIDFPFSHDTWFMITVYVNLNTDIAQLWMGSTMIHQWQWTRANPGTYALRLAANDFYGPSQISGGDECYYDDYWFADFPVPVELTSFTANVNNLGQVVLNWETATELNNQGFEIERRTESTEFRTIGYVEGYGTTTEPRSYSYIDKFAENGINYYRLKQIDFNGTYAYSDVVEVEVIGPLTFNLQQNYPNPFNPSTQIKYSVPESGNIRLSVFNIVGEEVAVLADGFTQAGFYEATFNASNLPSGVYVYKLQSTNSVQAKKMLLLK